MSEMIENVARAIQKVDGWTKWEELPDETTSFGRGKETIYAEARAAIEAMREPTEEMLRAANAEETTDLDIWQAMIDEALR